MPRCDSIRESLTAWIDGELPPRDEHLVVTHLANCPACSAEADSLRQTIAWQTQTLPQRLLEAPVDGGALRMGLHRQLAALREREERAPSWSWPWLLRPFAVATAGLALTLLVVVWSAGEPETLLVSLGVEAPPAEVATKPEMFQYLEVIENLEALEHFESVQAVRLEDERAHADTVRRG